MSDVLTQLRNACATIAQRARHVELKTTAIAAYAEALPLALNQPAEPDLPIAAASAEEAAAYWLTLDAINFGSGWFPTLRKRPGVSGYHTVAAGIRDRFLALGSWSAGELRRIDAAEIAGVLGQDPAHELMELFARSLSELGRHIEREHRGSFLGLVESANGSARALVEQLAGLSCFADVSAYDGLSVPFLKRAQIAAADLARGDVARFGDLDRLTMFADNLVPHVLRLDGILTFEPRLVDRIEREQLIEHGSAEEVEIRACALHAVELIVAACPGSTAAEIDQFLWLRGQQPRYKSVPRHRSRTTAY